MLDSGPMRSVVLGLLFALGCGGRATISAEAGGGAAGVGGTAGNATAGSSNGSASAGASGACGIQCPSPFLDIQLAVISSAGTGELSGVQATLSGPVTVQLNCFGFAQTTLCLPGDGGPAGNYSLQVSAPGFQTVTVAATVRVTPPEGCGCGVANLQPTVVTLNPLR
jgi:hypothetical protein